MTRKLFQKWLKAKSVSKANGNNEDIAYIEKIK